MTEEDKKAKKQEKKEKKEKEKKKNKEKEKEKNKEKKQDDNEGGTTSASTSTSTEIATNDAEDIGKKKKRDSSTIASSSAKRVKHGDAAAIGSDSDSASENDNEGEDEDEAQDEDGDSDRYLVSPIAKPLAQGKVKKKALKLVGKASKSKIVRRGVREVQKALRKKQGGLCILAGDISPLDVISHLPVLCEEHDVSYIFVPSKVGLGAAALTKRPTSCVLIVPSASKDKAWKYQSEFNELEKVAKSLAPA